MARPGSTDSRGTREPGRLALAADDLAQRLGDVRAARAGRRPGCTRCRGRRRGRSRAARRRARRGSRRAADDAVGGDLEAGGVEDLRADVGVDADQLQAVAACSTRRTASAAWPPASARPNFWSSWAVAMNSWVCASTPTVTRICTRWRLPSLLGDVRDADDLLERVEHDPADAGLDRPLDLGGRLVVAVQGDALGGHARRASAMASSPPEQTSRLSPSSCSQRTTARDRNALPA